MDCIDLRTICKERRWRWRYDDASITSRNEDAAWHVEVRCQNGLIYPLGGDQLLVCVDGHPNMPSRLRALGSEVHPHQGNLVFRFPMALLEKVAEVMRPKRKHPGAIANLAAFTGKHTAQSGTTAVESPGSPSLVP